MLQIEFMKRMTNGGIDVSDKFNACQLKRRCLAMRLKKFIFYTPKKVLSTDFSRLVIEESRLKSVLKTFSLFPKQTDGAQFFPNA
jgi:hypothetical protein